MANENELINQAQLYLRQLEELEQEVSYRRQQLEHHLRRYQRSPGVETRVDLQGSIAHFEKYYSLQFLSATGKERPAIENARQLILGIDGDWGAYEFRQLFEGVDYLSKVYSVQTKMQRASPDFRLQYGMTRAPIYRKARLGYYLSTREELRVRQIRFSSPGLVSFEGIGEVIKELRETLDYILTGVWVRNFLNIYYEVRSRELRKAENDARLSEANARSAEARAREAEANVRYLEARSRIKMAISQSIQDNKPRSSVEIIGVMQPTFCKSA